MPFAFGGGEILVIVVVSLCICTLATSLAMESAALFVPAFLLAFPVFLPSFPTLGPNEAIGLTLVVMFFGQTSTVSGYWFREQIDFVTARTVLLLTVPLAVIGRILSYWVPGSFLLIVFAGLLFALAGIVYREQRVDHHASFPDGGLAEAVPRLDLFDRFTFGFAGACAGLVGFAIGEISNITLFKRHGLTIQDSTGTSTVILYLTLLSAMITNVVIVEAGVFGDTGVTIPWAVAIIVAPVVLVGGQLGAFINSRLSERTALRTLTVVYVFVGLVTTARSIVPVIN